MSKDYASILILISKNINLEKILVHATCTSPIMHLICAPHPKFCITFVFNFSWVLQREIESNAYAKYWGGGGGGAIKVHCGRCTSGVWANKVAE